MPTNAENMQNAYRLIRDGRYLEAQQLLLPIVRDDAANADAWWLLANALQDGAKAQFALQQVLSLRPDDDRARKMLERVRAAGGTASQSPFSGASSPVQSMPVTDDLSRLSTSKSHPLDDPMRTRTSSADDYAPFAASPSPISGDPFAGVTIGNTYTVSTPANPVYTTPRRPASSNPCVIVLAIIGAFTLLICGACTVFTLTSAGSVSQAVEGVIGTLQADPNFRNFIDETGSTTFRESWLSSRLPSGLQAGGELEYGDTQNGTLDDDDIAYTFLGTAGDSVIITLNAIGISSDLDPLLKLYDPENLQVAQDDDGGDDLNSRIEYTLTSTGKYTIVVSRYRDTGDGEYVLGLQLASADREGV